MELFTAGDESQMNVIKRWIDESDIYLLILGGRYGSIESSTQKSYIHLEYEYAVATQKPLFAVVIDEACIEERVKVFGSKVIEIENSQKLKDFRALVLSKMVRFWCDPRDIKLAILETMSDLERRPDLVGWISGSEAVNGGALVEEFARLTKENSELRQQLSNSAGVSYEGLTYEGMSNLLTKTKPDLSLLSPRNSETIRAIAQELGDAEVNSLHLLWMISAYLRLPKRFGDAGSRKLLDGLEVLGILESDHSFGLPMYTLSETGKRFLIRFRLEHDTSSIEKYLVNKLDSLKPAESKQVQS